MEEAERLCDRVAIIDRGHIVDIGTPPELIRRHCPEQTVIVGTDDALGEGRFRAIPQVESVTRQGERVTIRGRGEDLVTHVIHCLAEHRIKVTDFRTERSTLEDVFLKVTGHSIRN
jgi:ABC-2 type transport system ATP-binding protein